MSEQAEDEIDPSWWAAASDSTTDPDDYQRPERIYLSLDASLKAPGLGDLQRRVLEVLALASSPMLVPDNWLDPYKPMMEFNGRRSPVPSDLDREQLALLARLAP